MRRSRKLFLLLPFLLLAHACGEITALVAFQQKFSRHFGLNSVDVSRSGAELAVTVGDLRLQTAPDAEREPVAREMAEFVRDHYDGYAGLETVAVRFSHTRKLVVATTSTTRSHRFSTTELGPPAAAGERNAGAADAY